MGGMTSASVTTVWRSRGIRDCGGGPRRPRGRCARWASFASSWVVEPDRATLFPAGLTASLRAGDRTKAFAVAVKTAAADAPSPGGRPRCRRGGGVPAVASVVKVRDIASAGAMPRGRPVGTCSRGRTGYRSPAPGRRVRKRRAAVGGRRTFAATSIQQPGSRKRAAVRPNRALSLAIIRKSAEIAGIDEQVACRLARVSAQWAA